jgi:hypothetical protein
MPSTTANVSVSHQCQIHPLEAFPASDSCGMGFSFTLGITSLTSGSSKGFRLL